MVAARAYDCKTRGHRNANGVGTEAHCWGICGLGMASGENELDEGKNKGGAGTIAHEDDRGGWDGKMVTIGGWVEETEIG